jgi:hypothetical protein
VVGRGIKVPHVLSGGGFVPHWSSSLVSRTLITTPRRAPSPHTTRSLPSFTTRAGVGDKEAGVAAERDYVTILIYWDHKFDKIRVIICSLKSSVMDLALVGGAQGPVSPHPRAFRAARGRSGA